MRTADEDGRRLLRVVRKGQRAGVTWRRARTVPLSARGTHGAEIAEATFTSGTGFGAQCPVRRAPGAPASADPHALDGPVTAAGTQAARPRHLAPGQTPT